MRAFQEEDVATVLGLSWTLCPRPARQEPAGRQSSRSRHKAGGCSLRGPGRSAVLLFPWHPVAHLGVSEGPEPQAFLSLQEGSTRRFDTSQFPQASWRLLCSEQRDAGDVCARVSWLGHARGSAERRACLTAPAAAPCTCRWGTFCWPAASGTTRTGANWSPSRSATVERSAPAGPPPGPRTNSRRRATPRPAASGGPWTPTGTGWPSSILLKSATSAPDCFTMRRMPVGFLPHPLPGKVHHEAAG